MAKASRIIPDPRARHYWDGDKLLGEALQPILKTPEAAWDVWLLYDRGVRWEGETPPRPSWWEHQLYGMPSERALDAARFASKAKLLER